METAAKLAAQGSSREEISEKLDQMIGANKSYLLPDDFDYLRRGGRLSPLVSYLGKTIRLAASFPDAWFDTMLLTPVFITQGGPGCIAVQVIKEI